jgi:hypothetical protein
MSEQEKEDIAVTLIDVVIMADSTSLLATKPADFATTEDEVAATQSLIDALNIPIPEKCFDIELILKKAKK